MSDRAVGAGAQAGVHVGRPLHQHLEQGGGAGTDQLLLGGRQL